MTSNEKVLYSRAEACELLSISAGTLDRLVRDEKIHPRRVGDRPLFTRKELERFAARKA